MSTEAQITANRLNAQASTGPTTAEGKSNSAKNGTTHGLFSRHDVIGKDEGPAYDELTAALQIELAPKGVLEQTLANEIRRATWCLRRCGKIESELSGSLDPLEVDDPRRLRTRISIDRARVQAHRLLRQSIAELRRLQTDRQFANELFDNESDLAEIGLADWRAITKADGDRVRTELRQQKMAHQKASEPANTNRTQSQPGCTRNATPRNATCPCNSGQKYKRCCGKGAAALLNNSPAVLKAA